MTSHRIGLSLSACCLAALLHRGDAGAAELGPDGALVFAVDALRTYSFEPSDDIAAAGISRLSWRVDGRLGASAFTDDRWARTVVATPLALHGRQAARIAASQSPGIVIRDASLFASLATSRFEVSMWGRAEGAEPSLAVVYGGDGYYGPSQFARVEAVRTGRETSDGWAEYATGPLDGSVWGRPVTGLVLTARYASAGRAGFDSLIATALHPQRSPTLLDPTASALVDAVEVRPAPGAPRPATRCTAVTAEADCGVGAECFYAHCVDAAVVWGPAPPASHRREITARWAYVAAHLQSDRNTARQHASAFVDAADRIAAVEDSAGFYGALREQVVALRDAHTALGEAPGADSVFSPETRVTSSGIDVCFGLVQNDFDHDPALRHAVFGVGGHGALAEPLAVGDLLTAVDGRDPTAWVESVAGRYLPNLPNDPASDPALASVALSSLITRHASTIALRHCTAAGCGDAQTVPVGEEMYARVTQRGGFDGDSLPCTGRFQPAVEGARTIDDQQVYVGDDPTGPITDVQFDGFSPGAASTLDRWVLPFSRAVQAERLLVDARFGTGGLFSLGFTVFHQLRGASDPSFGLFLPRGAVDDVDPPWLLGEAWFDCPARPANDACRWSGSDVVSTRQSVARPSTARTAWLVSYDVSMNDIVPRLLQGRTDFRIFGPHPTVGAYGARSGVPPIVVSWGVGSLQALDARFASTAAGAVAAPWASGTGVAPDEVVVQQLSDAVQGRDTILAAARRWLAR